MSSENIFTSVCRGKKTLRFWVKLEYLKRVFKRFSSLSLLTAKILRLLLLYTVLVQGPGAFLNWSRQADCNFPTFLSAKMFHSSSFFWPCHAKTCPLLSRGQFQAISLTDLTSKGKNADERRKDERMGNDFPRSLCPPPQLPYFRSFWNINSFGNFCRNVTFFVGGGGEILLGLLKQNKSCQCHFKSLAKVFAYCLNSMAQVFSLTAE